jgi:hypothetical protein
LAHFCGGLLIATAGKATEISYSDARSLVTIFFWGGGHIVTTGNVFFMFDYDAKAKEHQNTQQSD